VDNFLRDGLEEELSSAWANVKVTLAKARGVKVEDLGGLDTPAEGCVDLPYHYVIDVQKCIWVLGTSRSLSCVEEAFEGSIVE